MPALQKPTVPGEGPSQPPAALPALLDELNRGGKLSKGDKLVFSAFGAGFTTGACIIEWAK